MMIGARVGLGVGVPDTDGEEIEACMACEAGTFERVFGGSGVDVVVVVVVVELVKVDVCEADCALELDDATACRSREAFFAAAGALQRPHTSHCLRSISIQHHGSDLSPTALGTFLHAVGRPEFVVVQQCEHNAAHELNYNRHEGQQLYHDPKAKAHTLLRLQSLPSPPCRSSRAGPARGVGLEEVAFE